MKVKDLAKKFSHANMGHFVVDIRSAKWRAEGLHSFSPAGVDDLIKRKAPILDLTVGLVIVENNDLVVTAYERAE